MPVPTRALTTTAAVSAVPDDCTSCGDPGQVVTAAAPAPAQVAAAPSPDQATSSRVAWSGVLGVEGQTTGDGRLIEANALAWENLPLPLRYVPVDVGAHDGAVVVGTIETVSRQGGDITGTGFFDLEAPYGPEAMRQVQTGQQDGVSMDLDEVTFEVRVRAELLDQANQDMLDMIMGEPMDLPPADAQGRVTVATVNPDDELMVTTSARMRAATLVAIPAFDTARIHLADQAMAPGDQPPTDQPCDPETDPNCRPQDGQTPSPTPPGARGGAPTPPSGAAAVSVVASAAPDAPPAAWFSRPTFTGPTALTVTPEGQLFGHLAIWGTCHISHTHSGCVTPPHSAAGYAYFHTGSVLTAEGSEIPVGHITLDTLHAGERLSAAAAAAHYENTGAVVADVAAGEDAHGIWVAGALRPSVTPDQVRALRAAPLSGDWRRLSGNLELVAALAVNVPGYSVPRPRGLVAGGATQSLVASGMVPPRRVLRPGTVGALSVDDLRYLKRLADRERAEDSRRAAAGALPSGDELARRVRASALAVRAHRSLV